MHTFAHVKTIKDTCLKADGTMVFLGLQTTFLQTNAVPPSAECDSGKGFGYGLWNAKGHVRTLLNGLKFCQVKDSQRPVTHKRMAQRSSGLVSLSDSPRSKLCWTSVLLMLCKGSRLSSAVALHCCNYSQSPKRFL